FGAALAARFGAALLAFLATLRAAAFFAFLAGRLAFAFLATFFAFLAAFFGAFFRAFFDAMARSPWLRLYRRWRPKRSRTCVGVDWRALIGPGTGGFQLGGDAQQRGLVAETPQKLDPDGQVGAVPVKRNA